MTKKKGKAAKTKLIDEVRQCADEYERAFVISYANMRTTKLQQLREQWKGSRYAPVKCVVLFENLFADRLPL